MNRKQRRIAAKRAVKSNQSAPRTFLTPLANDRELLAFGAYYKGDTAEGMGITFSTVRSNYFTADMLASMYNHVVEDGNRMLQTYYMRGAARCDRNTLCSYLETAVRDYNLALHGDTTQPELGVYKDFAINSDVIAAFVQCATLIAVLVCLGVINDDNQNGLHTMQTDKQFA